MDGRPNEMTMESLVDDLVWRQAPAAASRRITSL
jgi:hypothetical protein